MARIERDQPWRRHLHDYAVIDGETLEDVAVFDDAAEAWALAATRRGKVSMVTTLHPDGCGCPEAPRPNRHERRLRARGHP
jgi:hypothetical protein